MNQVLVLGQSRIVGCDRTTFVRVQIVWTFMLTHVDSVSTRFSGLQVRFLMRLHAWKVCDNQMFSVAMNEVGV